MLALYRSGRQADALETFQEARRVLADELGLEPGPELRRLQEAILAHDPAIAAVPAVRRRRGNLPAPSTSFVGREDELAEVAALLHEHRLVTLTGPPGVGKSRLAVETARSLEPEFPDGIWFVDFARAGGADDAVRLLAQPWTSVAPTRSRVSRRGFAMPSALVVLDACEHVLEEAARIASTLLAESPGVADSGDEPRGASRHGRSANARRAARRRRPWSSFSSARGRRGPASSPTREAVALAAEIVRRVDGLPLAIELAAARVNVLGLAELVSILERRAALLRDTPASDPARTALQGLVEWSYDLLHGDEKTLLQQLAVHRGGASLRVPRRGRGDARPRRGDGRRICSRRWSTSRSCPPRSPAAPRATTCSTASASTCSSGLPRAAGSRAVRGAHAEYFAALAEEAREGLRGPEWLAWEHRLELGERQPLGCARVRAGRARLCRRGSARHARVVFRARRACFRRTAIPRARLARRVTMSRSGCGSSSSPASAISRPKSSISTPRSRQASGPLALAATAAAPWQLGSRSSRSRSPWPSPATWSGLPSWPSGAGHVEAAGDDWGVAASGLIRAIGCGASRRRRNGRGDGGGDRPHSDAIDYDAFRVPALLLEAWVAERRQDGAAAARLTAARSTCADASGSATTRRSPSRGSASNALANGDLREAEELPAAGARAAEAAEASWVAAHGAGPARAHAGGGRRRGDRRAALP